MAAGGKRHWDEEREVGFIAECSEEDAGEHWPTVDQQSCQPEQPRG